MAKKSVKTTAKKHKLRLACISCDREDGDGVPAVPEGWLEVEAINLGTRGPADWWTHLGYCPDCAKDLF